MPDPASAALPTPRRPWSVTERNWLLGLAIAAGLVLVFTAVRRAEGWDDEARVVWNASETSTRFLAIAHTVVATAFLLSSRRMRGPRGWAWFGGLTLAGVGTCLGYHALGGKHAPLAEFLFYAYFLAHEIRDEIFFYRVNGDAPEGRDGDAARALWTAPVVAAAALGAAVFAAAAFRLGGPSRLMLVLDDLDPAARFAAGGAVLLVAAALVVAVKRRYDRLDPDGLRGLVRRHRPLFMVYAGVYAALLAGIALTGRMYAIVAIHVCIWYVFTLRQLKTRPAPSPAPRPLSWAWVRTTTAGFNAFHLGVLALVAALAVWRSIAFQNAPDPAALNILVSKDSFPYWTLLHVTWSWVPRG